MKWRGHGWPRVQTVIVVLLMEYESKRPLLSNRKHAPLNSICSPSHFVKAQHSHTGTTHIVEARVLPNTSQMWSGPTCIL